MKIAYKIRISGIVQGVGYRPYIYKTAVDMNISGYVANTGGEVLIHAEGIEHELEAFTECLRKNHPEGSSVNSVDIILTEIKNFSDFRIVESIPNKQVSIAIPPDISICKKCINDISDSSSRYFSYPFTSCTKCGPRFSIISDIPFDRENTAMNEFEMCDDCNKEYENPEDRRHHAQTICCPKCGPSFKLLDNQGKEQDEESFKKARRLIKQGFILAVKGVGGYHLICDAKNNEAVRILRERKKREKKPFAVMFKNLDSLSKSCLMNENEKKIIQSREKPIVLLKQKDSSNLSELINPGLNRVGAMLPYSAIHYLLFDDEIDSIVATSGNITGQPLIIDDKKVLESLKSIADYFLVHNRKIINRCDDSVVLNGQFVRRARGYSPVSLKLSYSNNSEILACGADLKNTFTLIKGDTAYISQYIGDLSSIETYDAYKETIKQYKRLFKINTDIVVCDMHPDYLSTRYAKKSGAKIIKVQHHHAHIASVIAEHGIKEEVISVAFDGTGYGTDGTIWGGEFFKASLNGFERVAHIKEMLLPGGEFTAKEPWRMAAIYLNKSFGNEYKNLKIPCIEEIQKSNGEVLIKAVESGINSVISTSAGRLFDAISALLGICYMNTYEGQAAAELEAIADIKQTKLYDYEIQKGEMSVIDFAKTISSIVQEIKAGRPISEIAGAFHNTIAYSIAEMCRNIRKNTGLRIVALSGGVFQNQLLLRNTIKLLENDGFNVYINNIVPCNDGGISFGQAAIALNSL